MKILVTGACGFIGYHLMKKLNELGENVYGIDSINEYYDVKLKYDRLEDIGFDKGLVLENKFCESNKFRNLFFRKIELEEKSELSKIFEEFHFNVVINLAAQAGVRYSLENPDVYVSSNVQGFLNILECCKATKVGHLVYASSSSVYGLSKEEKFSAKQSVDHPISIYAATKRANELMAHVYSHLFEMPITGLRFFTVYGPWGRPDMAPMLFANAILNEKPIAVFNYGNLQRDFTYIDDIVDGICKVIYKIPSTNKATGLTFTPDKSTAPFAIYNIGNNNPIKLLDFIKILETELGKKAILNMLPMQPGDVFSTYADIEPMVKDFNYSPATTLKIGIQEFVKWYKLYNKKN